MSKDQKYSFEEFKLFYESTEKVTDRRLATDKWNFSICVAIIFAIANIWMWTLKNPEYTYAIYTIIVILSFTAMLFARLWQHQVTDFKLLNTAKFEVLNEMSSNVVFDPDHPEVVSTNPFQKEWVKLQRLNALQDIKKKDILALKSSNTEYFIPKTFSVIFALITLVAVITIFCHLASFIQSWRYILQF